LDVESVLAELSAAQLAEWQAYYQLEPFGGQWQQTALLASLIANANRDPEQKPEPFTVEDFLPGSAGQDEEADDEADDPLPGLPPNRESTDLGEGEEPAWMSWKASMQALASNG
jgi:hypothetical protein